MIAKLKPWLLSAIPLFLLLLALSSVFLFGNDRGLFYRAGSGLHGFATAQQMAQSVNLSPEHNFIPFVQRALDVNGEPSYTVYTRWPIGGYALVKLATLPFDGDLSAQLHAARVLMLLLFCGTVLLTYLALCRLAENRWTALTATLLTFSSYYFLYYNDMVATEGGMALFGVMLTFHGVVVFVQEGRFRQLLVKACLALLLGWQVYALLLPFIIFSLLKEWIESRSITAPLSRASQQFRLRIGILLSSRHLMLGVVTLLFGILSLSWNLGSEYFALDGYYSLTRLPTVESLRRRFGEDLIALGTDTLGWVTYLKNLFHRIGAMGLPFALNPFGNSAAHASGAWLTGTLEILLSGISLLGLIFSRNKILLATLLLSGFVWALPFRGFVAHHDFQSVFHIGIPLVSFTFFMMLACKLLSRKVIYACAVAALLVFVHSTVQMAHVGDSPEQQAIEAEIMGDFVAIRSLIGRDKVVYIPFRDTDPQPFGASFGASYFLAGTGSIIEYQRMAFATKGLTRRERTQGKREGTQGRVGLADFVILPFRLPVPALLTPNNRRAFLYDLHLFSGGLYSGHTLGQLGNPVIESDYVVYLLQNTLIYIQEECRPSEAKFFLHVYPVNETDLPHRSRQHGYENLDHRFMDYPVLTGRECAEMVWLSSFDIARIRTGQYIPGKGRVWEEEFSFDE